MFAVLDVRPHRVNVCLYAEAERRGLVTGCRDGMVATGSVFD